MTELKMGIYRHYKGPLYQVLGIAHDANADTLGDRASWFRKSAAVEDLVVTVDPLGERTVVVYIGLQLDEAHLGPRLSVRTLEDFLGGVEDPSFPEVVLMDGRTARWKKRFVYLGPELTAEMIT